MEPWLIETLMEHNILWNLILRLWHVKPLNLNFLSHMVTCTSVKVYEGMSYFKPHCSYVHMHMARQS